MLVLLVLIRREFLLMQGKAMGHPKSWKDRIGRLGRTCRLCSSGTHGSLQSCHWRATRSSHQGLGDWYRGICQFHRVLCYQWSWRRWHRVISYGSRQISYYNSSLWWRARSCTLQGLLWLFYSNFPRVLQACLQVLGALVSWFLK